ncbi:PREDICTED: xylosyltransferase oxt-like [Acropora digitifera]|uniref:xylosyltransferase oxt-like n=1 Tax=Acropora digitifera TaxID=70779 RepID=UPI00077A295C|nr:PREDICTED: xylosyltransferase oxt-like [Acropora digitifera]
MAFASLSKNCTSCYGKIALRPSKHCRVASSAEVVVSYPQSILLGYVGCFEDKSSERDLPRVLSVSHLTPDTCRTACQNAGHAYAGVQYGYLCRCGDTYGKYGKIPDEECNALCSGDKMQKCGGFWKSAIFTTAGAMQPSKRGNFFHIESVQPITEGT